MPQETDVQTYFGGLGRGEAHGFGGPRRRLRRGLLPIWQRSGGFAIVKGRARWMLLLTVLASVGCMPVAVCQGTACIPTLNSAYAGTIL